MKYFLFLISLSIFCACSPYSQGLTRTRERFIDVCGIGNDKEYIIYEFGFSKINSVYIVKNRTDLDVYVSDGNKVSFSTRCEFSPIIRWAFEKAPHEYASLRFDRIDEYKSPYYKLTIMENGTPIIIDSSSIQIIGNEDVVEKIDELKKFIISLWIESLGLQKID